MLDICPHKRRHDVIPSIHVAEIVNRVLEVLVPSGHALIFAYLDRCFVVDSDDDGSGKWMTWVGTRQLSAWELTNTLVFRQKVRSDQFCWVMGSCDEPIGRVYKAV